MAWSYSKNPANSLLDAVRYEIGDTIETDQLLQDEEIQYELTRSGNDVLRAAARCCEAIASKFARLADSTMGQASIQASQKYAQYSAKANKLWSRATKRAVPFSGSANVSAAFSRGMMDNEDEGALI